MSKTTLGYLIRHGFVPYSGESSKVTYNEEIWEEEDINSVYRRGDICLFNFKVRRDTYMLADTALGIITIPQEYTPRNREWIPLLITYTPVEGTFTRRAGTSILLDTNGTINLQSIADLLLGLNAKEDLQHITLEFSNVAWQINPNYL